MRVQLLCFDDCPNWRVATGRVQEALEAVGRQVEVERVLDATPEQAEEWVFHGPLSLLIDGKDPFAQPDAPVWLACRIYPTRDGIGGSPTVAQLVEVLSRRNCSSQRRPREALCGPTEHQNADRSTPRRDR